MVTFLCTRVHSAIVEDQKKLMRVLGYLKGTVDPTLMLRAMGDECRVVAYIDAAYALYSDSKSHSGVVVYVGNMLVYISSKKQKGMSRSQ